MPDDNLMQEIHSTKNHVSLKHIQGHRRLTFYIEKRCVELKLPVAAYLSPIGIPNVLITNS